MKEVEFKKLLLFRVIFLQVLAEGSVCAGRAARVDVDLWLVLHQPAVALHGLRVHAVQLSPGRLHLRLPLLHERQGCALL